MKDGIFLFQEKYPNELDKKYGLENTNPTRTLMSTTLKLHQDPSGNEVEKTLFKSMIESLFYLTASLLDISISVEVCARF